MENVALGFADRPEAILALVMSGVLPDQNRPFEYSGAIIEADATLAQGPGVLGFIPFEFHNRIEYA
jgi:hypothetical protein